jgi:hypothetical protein
MELGSLLTSTTPFSPTLIPASTLASILTHLSTNSITSKTAKLLLSLKFSGDPRTIPDIIADEGLELKPMTEEEYEKLARQLVQEKPEMVRDVVERGQVRKVGWFVGQMMGRGREGSVEPGEAERVVRWLPHSIRRWASMVLTILGRFESFVQTSQSPGLPIVLELLALSLAVEARLAFSISLHAYATRTTASSINSNRTSIAMVCMRRLALTHLRSRL